MKQDVGRGDVLHVADGRLAGEHGPHGRLPGVAPKVVGHQAPGVALAKERGQIIHPALRAGGLEALVVADNPGHEVAGVGAPGHGELSGVGPALGHGFIEGREHVAARPSAPVVDVGAQKILPVAARTARVAIHHAVALAGEVLKLVPHAGLARPPHGRRPTVNFEHHRVLAAGLVGGGLHHPVLHGQALVVHEAVLFGPRQLAGLHPVVEVAHRLRLFQAGIAQHQFGRVLNARLGVHHLAPGHIKAQHARVGRRELLYFSGFNVGPVQRSAAVALGREVHVLIVVAPGQVALAAVKRNDDNVLHGAVEWHHGQLGHGHTHGGRHLKSQPLARRRHRGVEVGSAVLAQQTVRPAAVAVGQVHFVLQRAVGVLERVNVGRQQQVLAIGGEGGLVEAVEAPRQGHGLGIGGGGANEEKLRKGLLGRHVLLVLKIEFGEHLGLFVGFVPVEVGPNFGQAAVGVGLGGGSRQLVVFIKAGLFEGPARPGFGRVQQRVLQQLAQRNGRREKHLPAIGRPLRGRGTVLVAGQLAGLAAVGGHHKHLGLVVDGAHEGELPPVGAPGRLGGALFGRGELPGHAPRRGADLVELAHIFVVRLVLLVGFHAQHREGRLSSVTGQRNAAHLLDFQQIRHFHGFGAALRNGGLGSEAAQQAKGRFLHSGCAGVKNETRGLQLVAFWFKKRELAIGWAGAVAARCTGPANCFDGRADAPDLLVGLGSSPFLPPFRGCRAGCSRRSWASNQRRATGTGSGKAQQRRGIGGAGLGTDRGDGQQKNAAFQHYFSQKEPWPQHSKRPVIGRKVAANQPHPAQGPAAFRPAAPGRRCMANGPHQAKTIALSWAQRGAQEAGGGAGSTGTTAVSLTIKTAPPPGQPSAITPPLGSRLLYENLYDCGFDYSAKFF